MERISLGTLFARPSGNSQLEAVKVELVNDHLIVSKHDRVYEDVLASNEITNEREVTLEREAIGLGFSIQGGIDFKCPIKVYRVFPNSSAARLGLDEKDVILTVNGVTMWGKSHDQAAHHIRNAGDRVTLRICRLVLREYEDQQEIADQWLSLADVPLKMASITRYQPGTAVLKPNQVQVMSRDGLSSVTLHCQDDGSRHLTECVTIIKDRIDYLSQREMDECNNVLDDHEKILMMGWVSEHLSSAANMKVWQRKFLVLRHFQLQIYNLPPEEVAEWERAERSCKYIEMSVKVMEPHSFPEQRANSIIVTSGYGTSHIFSFENRANLKTWTKLLNDQTVRAALHLQHQQFSAEWRDQYVYFILDIRRGFVICSREDLSIELWRKPFSSLRRSTDDGHSRLRLECSVGNSTAIEVQEIELEDMQVAVCCMECFIMAKVAALDPGFIALTDLVA